MQTITDDQKILLDRIYYDASGRHQGAFSTALPLYKEAKKKIKKKDYIEIRQTVLAVR